MNEYTTNQPIGSTCSNEPIFNKASLICNGTCEGTKSTCPLHSHFFSECDYCREKFEQNTIHFCRKKAEDVRDKAIIYELQKQMKENCGAHSLAPLDEALQSKCPRCNMRWIIHNCPQYPKLLDAKEMIKKLARGAVLKETAENADYFTSIKCGGEEFNVYIRENKLVI